ncbi:YfbU family protein [Paenibacillus sp. sptzw28]|uniref:YfbU family protein n=1 Tax=Paenibacillus sp. sptzw28 TaxID=715179 RepID=UPI001C6F15F2|nr:YfbU family protein [Paenibacillus sp. sptzw28]QYR20789.1 YfbU family protein [Paenibacillus sp. sptzw28]
MDLSKKERLMLYNQYEILERLNPQDAETYRTFRTILSNGYEAHYGDLVESFYAEMSKEASDLVVDVLDMYSCLHNSYAALEDKSGIEEWQIDFPGFDGNNEISELGYTRFFLHDLDRFSELQRDGHAQYNSHSRMKTKYRAMLEVWRAKEERYNLSKADIIEIINTR